MDSILKRLGMKYDDLNDSEKETLQSWLTALQTTALTIDRIKESISSMKYAVEQEIIDTPETIFFFPNRKQILLKARLRNYMLIEAFLTSPERAKAAIEQSILSLKK